jgi:exodeoxyribonuclease III
MLSLRFGISFNCRPLEHAKGDPWWTMQIASWNVNSVRMRLEQVRAWLERERPEVLCLQETKVDDPLFPHSAFRELGYSSAISGQKAYNGVAILSTRPLEDVQLGFSALLPGDPDAAQLDQQKRVISARIDGLRVLNLYVPNGSSLKSEKYSYKLAWLACLERYLGEQEQQEEPLCMVGDFNIGPESRDLSDPERQTGGIMASEPERQALRSVLGKRLHDVFRLFEADPGHWSWWDYRSGAWERDQGWRIDHIYLDPDLMDLATGCVIHKATRGNPQPSDHAPVVVKLAWPPDDEEEQPL